MHSENGVHEGAAIDREAALRQLARRAVGFSGADIERLVREARQRARRDRRMLTYGDLDALLAATRPTMSPEKRRRVAVHEAGHLLLRVLLGVGEVTLVTIEAVGGDAFTESIGTEGMIDTQQACEDYLAVIMGGRAAEQVVYRSALAGSGGSSQSDLAQATRLATVMEVSLGFGSRHPLLYRDPDHAQTMLRQNLSLAHRVHTRIDKAERRARRLVRKNCSQLELVVDELLKHGTIEGGQLANLLQSLPTRR
jgi:ATP-dependent Zn protease